MLHGRKLSSGSVKDNKQFGQLSVVLPGAEAAQFWLHIMISFCNRNRQHQQQAAGNSNSNNGRNCSSAKETKQRGNISSLAREEGRGRVYEETLPTAGTSLVVWPWSCQLAASRLPSHPVYCWHSSLSPPLSAYLFLSLLCFFYALCSADSLIYNRWLVTPKEVNKKQIACWIWNIYWTNATYFRF